MNKFLYMFSSLMLCLYASTAVQAQTETSTKVGDYLVHHTIFNSSFLSPEVAATYELTRGKDKAIVNVAVTKAGAGASSFGLPVQVSGEARNLMQQQTKLNFIEISEQNATYYIAPFEFDDQEIMHFDLYVVLPGNTRPTSVRVSKKMYED